MKVLIVHIKRKGLIVRIANLFMKIQAGEMLATTIHKTIHLLGGTPKQLITNYQFMRHEVQHVIQCKEDGLFKFCIKYLWYSIRYHYDNNPYELDAINHSHDNFPEGIILVSDEFLVMKATTFEKLFYIRADQWSKISVPEINRVLNLNFKVTPYIYIQE